MVWLKVAESTLAEIAVHSLSFLFLSSHHVQCLHMFPTVTSIPLTINFDHRLLCIAHLTHPLVCFLHLEKERVNMQ